MLSKTEQQLTEERNVRNKNQQLVSTKRYEKLLINLYVIDYCGAEFKCSHLHLIWASNCVESMVVFMKIRKFCFKLEIRCSLKLSVLIPNTKIEL